MKLNRKASGGENTWSFLKPAFNQIKKWKRNSWLALVFTLLLSVPFLITQYSCSDEGLAAIDSLLSSGDISALASYLFNDEKLDSIPQDLDINDNTTGLPSSVDLTGKFPPIGNQGQYGTCVAWASGYNLKTALNGIDKGWTSSQLAQASNQTSPKDLFWSLSSDVKGTDCGGTYFEAALDLMISRGVATLSTVPYDGLGDCSSSPDASWTTSAASNKLNNYRKIASDDDASSMTVDNFKAYLAEGRPIVFGAKLGDRFMYWNSDDVISYDTYTNPGMQHAYHALILAGYNDAKSAFRVINSWGPDWGDNGYIWVDYNFFLTSFCYAAFVAQNTSTASVSNNQVGSGSILSGNDVMAYGLIDEDDPDVNGDTLAREIIYNVYNSGTTTITASMRWSILYLYYNAFDANDYQILIHDYYTDEFGAGDGEWADGQGLAANWWNNCDVTSGQSVAAAMYADADANFRFTYNMPETVNGQYYLVLFADGFNVIDEANEDNNYYFYSRSDGQPFKFENGVLTNPEARKKKSVLSGKPAPFANSNYQTLVKPGNLNTYSPSEIKQFLIHEKNTGRLQQKVDAFDKRQHGNVKRKYRL